MVQMPKRDEIYMKNYTENVSKSVKKRLTAQLPIEEKLILGECNKNNVHTLSIVDDYFYCILCGKEGYINDL
jgi:hypothetical protein